MTGDGPKMDHFGQKNDQTLQACRRTKVVQKGPKGTKMVNLSLFDHLGPFWAHLDPFGPFQTRIDILLWSTSAEPYFVHLGQKIIFVWNGPKGSRWIQTGSQMIKKTQVDHFGPFWAPLDHFGALTSLPCLAIFGPKWTIFGPSPVMNDGPQSKKKGSSPPMCRLLVERKNIPLGILKNGRDWWNN